MTQTSSSTLRRLAGSHGDAPESGAEPAKPSAVEEALATALLRVGEDVSPLALSLGERATRVATSADAFDGLDPLSLCLPIDPALAPDAARPGREAIAGLSGVLVLDPPFVDALVEVQTIARVDGPARAPRRPTRIDAALAQPFARAVLETLTTILPREHRGPRPGPLRQGSFLAGTEALPLNFTAPRWTCLRLDCALGGGARPAVLTLLLPDPDLDESSAEAEALDLPDPEWAERVAEVMRGAPVRLEAVIPPIRMTLADLVALEPGAVLPLEGEPLEQMRLVAGTSGRGRAARDRMPWGLTLEGRLGRLGQVRAMRIASLPGEPREDKAEAGLPARAGSQALPTTAAAAPPIASPDPDPLATLTEATVEDTVPIDLPELPGQSNSAEIPALPDLPDLPELPDLPDDPNAVELPDLPVMD